MIIELLQTLPRQRIYLSPFLKFPLHHILPLIFDPEMDMQTDGADDRQSQETQRDPMPFEKPWRVVVDLRCDDAETLDEDLALLLACPFFSLQGQPALLD